MDGADPLTFRILGKTCVVILPPTINDYPARETAENLNSEGRRQGDALGPRASLTRRKAAASQNCERNLGSFSNMRRMSGMP
jgi:hypothetical protein